MENWPPPVAVRRAGWLEALLDPMGTTNCNLDLPVASVPDDRIAPGGWVSSKFVQRLLGAYLTPSMRIWNRFLVPCVCMGRAGSMAGTCMPWFVSAPTGINTSLPSSCETGRNWICCGGSWISEPLIPRWIYRCLHAVARAPKFIPFSVSISLSGNPSPRPDLKLRLQAIDISQLWSSPERGVYSLRDVDLSNPPEHFGDTEFGASPGTRGGIRAHRFLNACPARKSTRCLR